MLLEQALSEYLPLTSSYTSTLSFSLNGLVPDDMNNKFSDMLVAVIDPIKYHQNEDYVNIDAIDTTIKGSIKTSEEAILVIEQNYFLGLTEEEKLLELKSMSEVDRIHKYFAEYINSVDKRDYEKAYGYLKSEHGVHRLVRISPFDSGARRHTSFCGCFITPVLQDSIDIEVKQEDIRIDTYRASGAGGQHINKTDSAIRITHMPTGIVVTCQNQRSQIQNREKAMEILKSKLYAIEREKQDNKLKNVTGNASINGFGGEVIRSYVFCPYCLVKDNRTDYETSNTQGVMDGDLDGFINAYLKSNYNG